MAADWLGVQFNHVGGNAILTRITALDPGDPGLTVAVVENTVAVESHLPKDSPQACPQDSSLARSTTSAETRSVSAQRSARSSDLTCQHQRPLPPPRAGGGGGTDAGTEPVPKGLDDPSVCLHPRVEAGLSSPIPGLRMFDLPATCRFYLDYLGCEIDWQEPEGDRPMFMQVSRGPLEPLACTVNRARTEATVNGCIPVEASTAPSRQTGRLRAAQVPTSEEGGTHASFRSGRARGHDRSRSD